MTATVDTSGETISSVARRRTEATAYSPRVAAENAFYRLESWGLLNGTVFLQKDVQAEGPRLLNWMTDFGREAPYRRVMQLVIEDGRHTNHYFFDLKRREVGLIESEVMVRRSDGAPLNDACIAPVVISHLPETRTVGLMVGEYYHERAYGRALHLDLWATDLAAISFAAQTEKFEVIGAPDARLFPRIDETIVLATSPDDWAQIANTVLPMAA